MRHPSWRPSGRKKLIKEWRGDTGNRSTHPLLTASVACTTLRKYSSRVYAPFRRGSPRRSAKINNGFWSFTVYSRGHAALNSVQEYSSTQFHSGADTYALRIGYGAVQYGTRARADCTAFGASRPSSGPSYNRCADNLNRYRKANAARKRQSLRLCSANFRPDAGKPLKRLPCLRLSRTQLTTPKESAITAVRFMSSR